MRTRSSVWRCRLGLVVGLFAALVPLAAAHAQETHHIGEINSNNSLKLRMLWCPAGKFTMGSPATERDDDEAQVQVTIRKGFWLG